MESLFYLGEMCFLNQPSGKKVKLSNLLILGEDFNPSPVSPPLEGKPPYKAGSSPGAVAKWETFRIDFSLMVFSHLSR